MKLTELIRNKVFWFVDQLEGGKKRFYYNTIKAILENPLSPQSIDYKKEFLKNILEHAVSSTEHYKHLTPYTSVEDFPVVNKNIIREHFEDFESEMYRNKPKFTISTSGSTGTPFRVCQNMDKKIRNIADTIYFSEKAGFRVGYKLTFFRLWDAFEQKEKITRILQNVIPVDVFELNKAGEINTIIEALSRSKSSDSWLGYASAYEMICKYLDRKESSPIPNNLKSIIAISERLHDHTKQSVLKYFGTEVVSRYSNVENGIIAQQPLGNKKYFEINEASYFVEILEMDSNDSVEEGKPGRIVITDLFNYALPMIRYDTGDIGVKGTIDGKAIFQEVHGRKIDLIYDTKGELITVNLVLLVNNYSELKQCQLIQKGKGTYHFKLNCEQEFLRENDFKCDFKKFLGENAQITFEYVDEIPLLASGKRRVMVNEMMNTSSIRKEVH